MKLKDFLGAFKVSAVGFLLMPPIIMRLSLMFPIVALDSFLKVRKNTKTNPSYK
tara:strand:+ start:445 stop:606 length:162 start_codon:yes stop_codon:yes gene_type:complete